MAVFLVVNISCKQNDRKDKNGNPVLDFTVDKSYILLPIEEKALEVQMHVDVPGEKEQAPINIRIAQHNIDYWVTLDVKKYQGRTVTLTFEGIKDADYLVLYTIREQYRPDDVKLLNLMQNVKPEHTVFIDGLEYARIYKITDMPKNIYSTLMKE